MVTGAVIGAVPSTQPQSDVRAFGAVGDGKTKDTAAFQQALDACAHAGGGEVLVPPGNYLIGSVQLGSRTVLRLSKDAIITGSPDKADYPMTRVRWEGRWEQGRRALIYSEGADDIAIIGPGRIDGNAKVAASQNPRGSVVLEPINCDNVRWEDFTVTQGGNWATHPTCCKNVSIQNITISGKRDGIDVDSCSAVQIVGCNIDTGDDCISLKSGRGAAAVKANLPTADVYIAHCTLNDRKFACVGIGSETSGGIRDVRMEHCKMTAERDAVYIKSRIGRGGTIENISGSDLEVTAGIFLRINLTSAGNTNTTDDPLPGLAGYPVGRHFVFSDIRLNHASRIIDAVKIAAESPLDGLSVSKVSGTAEKGIQLDHVKNIELSEIHVTVDKGVPLAIHDTTGTGIQDAAPYRPRKSNQPELDTPTEDAGGPGSISSMKVPATGPTTQQ
jgi:polygalacturonase